MVKTTCFQEFCSTGEQRNEKGVDTGEGHGIKDVSISSSNSIPRHISKRTQNTFT